jgi:hypothetical protein
MVAVLAFGCDETLPPRDEPQRFLAAALRVNSSPVRIDIDSSGLPPFGIPPYPERASGLGGSLGIVLVSHYSEVLQEFVEIRGTIDVWLAERPDVRTTITLSVADVDYPVFDPDGVLTLEPGDSVHAERQWSHIADNRFAFFRYVPLVRRQDYYESAPVRLNAAGTFQVFENVPAERTEVMEFELVYRIYVVYPP